MKVRLSAIESLEHRRLLTIAGDLSNLIMPYQQALNAALTSATSMPLVGNQLKALAEFSTILQTTESSIATQTQNITNNGHYQITVALPSLTKSFSFDLGLDAFLQAKATGNVSASINPTLYVGFDYNNGSVSLDLGQTRFDIGFGLSLPGFQGTFSFNGLLFTKAVDAGTNFNGTLGFQFANGGALNAQFSGEAHVRMGLTMSFVDPALDASFNPTFRTNLNLDWAFNPQTNQLTAPSIALVDFGLEADSFLQGFLGDVVTTVQKFTKPIQPFIDVFQTPVPILSAFDSSETIGTLMLKGSGISPQQQESFEVMVQIINAVNSINLPGAAGGAVIPFGTITITGNAQQSGSFGFDTSQLTNAIDDILGAPALQAVEDTLKDLGNYAGLNSTAGFQFPLLEDPGSIVAGILLGQSDSTLFSFSTGRQHFELAPSAGVGIPGVIGLFLQAGIIFDANLTMGYDTAGLVAIAQDPNHNLAHLLHGFYFDNSIDTSVPPIPNGPAIRKTGLYLQGLMQLKADALLAHVSGGLYANINVELVNTDSTNHVHLDTMINNLVSGGKVFNLSGKLYASADVSLALELPVGPDITLFSFNLAYEELLNFDPPPPPDFGVPVTVIDAVDQHTLLLDVNKMNAGSVVTVQPFHDLSVSLPGGGTTEADGIRVDYPGEIYLFVERKNDVTSNYYNFISLGGAVPDGVSINVIDPFRVFYDEGANAPFQTKPGVLLAGGKNVIYTYKETADGSQANVLLVGGYGSNTLTGGTMTFGNFVPGDRVAQAKAHFNSSGLDAAAQGVVNSQIDAAIAPANPAGIIGAKMTGSRGGLMMGGPGNNSFISTGAGDYEMIGGNWINTFNISPSFSGGPASYQIDAGGPKLGSMIVRVPFGETAEFENGTVPDKYLPEFKALDIYSNAGLFATAHGIGKVLAIGSPGSTIVFGDTSELDIDFKVKGSATLKFAGTNAPDQFDVNSEYDTFTNFLGQKQSGRAVGWYGTAGKYASLYLRPYPSNAYPADSAYPDVRVVPYDGRLTYVNDYYKDMWVPPVYTDTPYFYAVPQNGLFLYNYIAVNTGDPNTSTILPVAFEPGSTNYPPAYYFFDDPLYTVTRTFGTNGRTQSIEFEVDEIASSSIVLDGRGASDDYDINVGLGSFLDITVDDSDAANQNSMQVNFLDDRLLSHKATLTDNSLNLEYYTDSFHWVEASYNIFNLSQAVKYTPTINFGDNTDIVLTSAAQFKQTVIDRPRAPQSATMVANGLNPAGMFSIYSPIVDGIDEPGTFFERFNAPPIMPTLSIDSLEVSEGDEGTVQATFTVSLSFFSTGAVTVKVNTSDGTATLADGDYQAVSDLLLTFTPGGPLTQTVTVLVNGDIKGEPNETFFVNLSNATGAAILGGQGVGTILNDDAVVLPTLSIDSVTLSEGNAGTTSFNFTVTLSFDPVAPVTVTVNTANGTASIVGNDYQTVANLVLTFNPGGPLTQTVTVLVNGDTNFEADETFFVNLSNATGATIENSQGPGTILNDDISTTPNRGPQDVIVLGADAGARPRVKVIDARDGTMIASFLAYKSSFSGGVRVAVADLDGEGTAEIIVAPGAGHSTLVKVFDLDGNELPDNRTKAYKGFNGGVFVAAGDINGDGRPDIITSPGAGMKAEIKVFKNRVGIASSNTDPISNNPIRSFLAFGSSFTGGAMVGSIGSGGTTVAAGDLTGDGRAEIVVGNGPGMGPRVRVFDLTTFTTTGLAPNILEIRPFKAEDRGGVFVAVGDVRGDNTPEIIVGNGAGGRGRVEMYNADGTRFKSVTAYQNGEGRSAPVHVATKNIDGDLLDEIITAQGAPGSIGNRRSFDSDGTLIDDIFEGEDDFRFGFFVA